MRIISDADLAHEEFDLVINATSLGINADDPLPLGLRILENAGAALDLNCGSDGTAWTRHATSLGIPAADGIEMLIAQGAAAFERW